MLASAGTARQQYSTKAQQLQKPLHPAAGGAGFADPQCMQLRSLPADEQLRVPRPYFAVLIQSFNCCSQAQLMFWEAIYGHGEA